MGVFFDCCNLSRSTVYCRIMLSPYTKHKEKVSLLEANGAGTGTGTWTEKTRIRGTETAATAAMAEAKFTNKGVVSFFAADASSSRSSQRPQ